MGVLRRSYFFCGFVDYITGKEPCLQEIFTNHIKRQEGKGGIQQASALCNVYNSPSHGVVGNIVCRMWESCLLLFHVL